jgi:hypothetical protein
MGGMTVMNQFEKGIFEEVKTLLGNTVENSDIKVEIEESEDEVVHAYFDNIGDYEGAIMTEINFITPYKDRDVEALQIFSTLAADVNDKLYPVIEEKINELNAMIIFGNFGLFPEGKQIFHRYVIPVQNGQSEFNSVNIKAAWEEIWSTLEYFLPYVLIVANEADIMEIDEYMEAMNEAD